MNNSTVGADVIEVKDKKETQLETAHIYVKVFFSILQEDNLEISPVENSVAEALVLRDVIGSNNKYIDIEEKIHETIIVDCSDLLVDDSGQVNDPEGQFCKILIAVEELHSIVETYKTKYERGIVHVAVFGFELFDDTAYGFSYMVDQDNRLGVVDEKLCSYIISTPSMFDDLKYNWFMWTEYMGIFNYFHLYQPLQGCVSTQVEKKTQNLDVEEPQTVLTGYVSKTEFDTNTKRRGWLDTTQLILEGASILPIPLVSEFSSLANGLIYLGKEIHAGIFLGDYDKMYEYRNESVKSFVGAIPGTSILKGTIKVIKAGKAVRKVQSAEKAFAAAQNNKKVAEKALRRVRNNKTTKTRIRSAKAKNKEAAQAVRVERQDLQKAIEERTNRLNESGLTIGDLTNESKNILRRGYKNYRNVMDTSNKAMRGKLQSTKIDKYIDRSDTTFKIINNDNNEAF